MTHRRSGAARDQTLRPERRPSSMPAPWSALRLAAVKVLGLLYSAVPAQVLTVDSLLHQGIQRRYTVHAPSTYDGMTPLPLVLNLHGGGGSMQTAQGFTQMNSVSESEGFLLVYPEGATPTLNGFSWADGRGTPADVAGIDDVGFIGRLLDTLEATHAVDPMRIHACGFSNGGFMTQRLACELSDRFAAIGSLGCSMDTLLAGQCAPSRTVPMVLFAGTADPEVPYGGGAMSSPLVPPVIPVDSLFGLWAALNGCTAPVVEQPLPDLVSDDSSTVERVDITGCVCGADVRLFRLIGAGHTWPGVEIPFLEPVLGQTNEDIQASAELWSFFEAHPLCISTGGEPHADDGLPPPYPNPFTDRLHLPAASDAEQPTILLDAYGRVVARSADRVLDIPDRPAGTYLVVWMGRNGRQVWRVLKH